MLAGLVGDPITRKYPKISKKYNIEGIKKLIINVNKFKNIKKFVFISTCSNYGVIKNKLATENSILNPKSTYAKAKIEIEKYIIKNKNLNFSTTILRFATAFGLSQE